MAKIKEINVTVGKSRTKNFNSNKLTISSTVTLEENDDEQSVTHKTFTRLNDEVNKLLDSI